MFLESCWMVDCGPLISTLAEGPCYSLSQQELKQELKQLMMTQHIYLSCIVYISGNIIFSDHLSSVLSTKFWFHLEEDQNWESDNSWMTSWLFCNNQCYVPTWWRRLPFTRNYQLLFLSNWWMMESFPSLCIIDEWLNFLFFARKPEYSSY